MREWKLQYTEPARTWFEALPLGNGELGAMCYGTVTEERIGLNLDSLWSGTGRDKGNEKTDRDWGYLRKLIREKRYGEAEEYTRLHVLGDWTECYLPAGDLILRLEDKENPAYKRYNRELELNRSVVTAKWEIGEVQYEKEAFVSIKERVMAIRLQASGKKEPEALKLRISLDSPIRHSFEKAGERTLILSGRAPVYAAPAYYKCENPIRYEEGEGTAFVLGVLADCEEGNARLEDDCLVVEGKGEITVYLTGGTDFNRIADLQKEAVRELENARRMGYEKLRKEHDKCFREYFERVDFSLGEQDSYESLSTIERVERFSEDQEDQNLAALLFHYGRYLLITSSKPGTQCANLQGIWNRLVQAPWSSNYTININTQMNYWMAESCNLSEFHEPFFELMKRIAERGSETAEKLYGLEGWVSHHNADIWGHATPVGGPADGNPCVFAMWPMSAGWMCRHLWEHYCYTLDLEFLRNTAYPLIEGAVRFYLGYLVPQDGYFVTMPSTSPENSFLDENGESHALSAASTMDISILKELFGYYRKICELLGVEGLKDRTEKALEKLPPFQVGANGQLQEWFWDYEEAEPHHRHVSHLYGLYPANVITKGQEGLRKACEVTLNCRGDEGTGWCIAWKAALWARLGNGNRAFKLLKEQMRYTTEEEVRLTGGGIYGNLFCAHPPFQIDGNFGYTAAVTEMLLQSQEEEIELLPAIPEDWKNGRVKGLKARGGYTVDFAWRDGKVREVHISALRPGKVVLHCNGERLELEFTEEGCMHSYGCVCFAFDGMGKPC